MDAQEDTTEFDLDDMPPGYILMRQDDGMYSFVKLEPHEQEEIIEEVENMEEAEIAPEEEEEEVVIGDKNTIKVKAERSYMALPEEQTLDELEIDGIPDIIEEDLASQSSFEQAASEAQIEFIEADADPPYNRVSIKISSENQLKKPSPEGAISFRSSTAPSGLIPEEVDQFKGQNILLKLAEQVVRNRTKVEIYSKKNDELKKLIGNQRDQMMKMGFPLKEIARFHTSKRRPRPPFPRMLDVEQLLKEGTDRLGYKAKRLQDEYNYHRKCLKAILSSHRRYKKLFVDNHEKLKQGPSKKVPFPATNAPLMKQVAPSYVEEYSDTDSEKSDVLDIKPPKTFKCYHCNHSAPSKKALATHIKRHLVPAKTYECPECDYVTPKVTQYMEHMKQHPGAKGFKCDHCDFKTAHPSALKNHKSVHMAVKPYKCPACPLRFGRSDHLRNHMRCHSNNRSYRCAECTYASKYASGLSNHIRRAHKKLYQQRKMAMKNSSAAADMKESESEDPGETTEIEVDASGKISAIRTITHRKAQAGSDGDEPRRRASTRQRVKSKALEDFTDGEEFEEALIKSEPVAEEEEEEEEEEGSIAVEERYDNMDGEVIEEEEEEEAEGDCETIVEDAAGTFFEDLEEEDEDDDAEEDPNFMVTRADERTGKKKDLLSSYVIYQCVWCDFSCEMKNALVDHSRAHMMAWTFTCKACGFEAKNPTDLHSHTEDHNNAGDFDCHYCDYTTTNKLKLKNHVEMRHPIGKPISCLHCDFISASRLAMKNHMLTHKARKMWQCTVCDYKAQFRSSLKRHLRKHTGERPYSCPHCEFTAAQYSHLTRHLRKYHPEEAPSLENRPPSPFVPIF